MMAVFGHTKLSAEAERLGEPHSANGPIEYYTSDNVEAGEDDVKLHDPESGVKRGLKNRHLSMMALDKTRHNM